SPYRNVQGSWNRSTPALRRARLASWLFSNLSRRKMHSVFYAHGKPAGEWQKSAAKGGRTRHLTLRTAPPKLSRKGEKPMTTTMEKLPRARSVAEAKQQLTAHGLTIMEDVLDAEGIARVRA